MHCKYEFNSPGVILKQYTVGREYYFLKFPNFSYLKKRSEEEPRKLA
jgi:hypothetical protein